MTDEELILLWQDEQDQHAATEIDSRWRRKLKAFFLRFVPPDVAEDLAQETLFRVFCKGGFREGSRFSPWIWTIAMRVLYDYYRRRGRLHELSIDAEDDAGISILDTMPSCDPGPDSDVRDVEFAVALHDCLAQLTPRDRFVVLARAMGVQNQEIAVILGCSDATAMRIYRRACEALKACLNAKGYHFRQANDTVTAGDVLMLFPDEVLVYEGKIPQGGTK